MKLQTIAIMLISVITSFSARAESKKEAGLKISFVVKEADKKVDVMIGGKLFTSYCWPDNAMKPVLYPVMTSEGTEITRGYPIKPSVLRLLLKKKRQPHVVKAVTKWLMENVVKKRQLLPVLIKMQTRQVKT